ncbi:hypothetical protein [Deinococcus marmoris]|uniref:Galactose-1-phosphate uridylyltransferase n=1 Tax=Deinococcus marmoris TaxID=249408 RepID=A0A1U7P595_9DEIO|nr:Galactose-1-phosphate uridylyltransferase [Deinococcus marmoris]
MCKNHKTLARSARSVSLLSELTPDERDAFARTLKDALLRLDALFGVRMPYLMTVHQSPLNAPHPIFPCTSNYIRTCGRQAA